MDPGRAFAAAISPAMSFTGRAGFTTTTFGTFATSTTGAKSRAGA